MQLASIIAKKSMARLRVVASDAQVNRAGRPHSPKMAPKLPRTISSLSQSAVNQLALDLSRLQFAKTAAGTSAASLSAVSRLAGSSGLCEIQARRTFFSRTMAGLAGSLDGSGSHWGQNAVRIAKRNSSSSNGPPKRTKVVRQSGRTRSEITYETNSGTFGGAGQVVRPLAAAPGVSVRRWRVWGTKRKPTKAKKDEPETYQQKKNKFPANPLKLDYDDAYMLADQVRWMVEKRGLHALALELIRRHALKDRTRELDARDDRRGAGPALKRRDEDVRRQSEERDEYEEADEGLMTWKWSMRSADDAVWNTFISACAIQGEYGWAEAGYQMVGWVWPSFTSSRSLSFP